MSAGKIASQAGHAFLDAYRQAQRTHPHIAEEYHSDQHGTKVCLAAKSLDALLRAEFEARAAGIPCALITDSGHVMPPHFDGSPIVTALGIGPARRADVSAITKKFNLIP